MLEQHDAHVICLEEPILDDACVAQLRSDIEGLFARGNVQNRVTIDLTNIETFTPRALAALLELGRRFPEGNLCLAGLSHRTTLLAVQVGLSEHFPIFRSSDAVRGIPSTSQGMRAIVYEVEGNVGAGAFDIAGRPLLIRQLQFLRDSGVEDVIVEVCDGHAAIERAASLLGADPLTARVHLLPSAHPLSVAELARRAGIPSDELFLALPADLVLHGSPDLQVASPTRYLFAPPEGVEEEKVSLQLRSVRNPADGAPGLTTKGWAMRIRNYERAHAVSCAALEGRTQGLLLHASEIRPGVWYARGARVSPDAQVVAPALIGPDARIFAGAKIGPRIVVGQACVIERDASLADVSLEAHTIVGDGTRIRGAHANARGMTSFADGSQFPVTDPLILSVRNPVGTALSSRLFALILLVLLATPWLLSLAVRKLLRRSPAPSANPRSTDVPSDAGRGVVNLLPALFDVVMGQRDLVGINDPQALAAASRERLVALRAGAFDLSKALAPGASTATLLRMWRWYQVHKSGPLDRALWREKAFLTSHKPE